MQNLNLQINAVSQKLIPHSFVLLFYALHLLVPFLK